MKSLLLVTLLAYCSLGRAAWETVDLASTSDGKIASAAPSNIATSPITGEMFFSFSRNSDKVAVVRCSFDEQNWSICFEEKGYIQPRVSFDSNGDVYVSVKKQVSVQIEQLDLFRRTKLGQKFEKISTLDLGENLISSHRIFANEQKIFFTGNVQANQSPFLKLLNLHDGSWSDLLYPVLDGEPVLFQTVSYSSKEGLVGTIQTQSKKVLVLYGENFSNYRILFTSDDAFSLGAVLGDTIVARRSYLEDQVWRYKIFMSLDLGQNWSVSDYPFLQKNGSNLLFNTAISNDGKIAMSGWDEVEFTQGIIQEAWTVRVSEDSGKTWQLTDFFPSDEGFSSDAYDVEFSPSGSIFACGTARINGVSQGRVRRLSH
jgi:hypothetical protein